MKILGIRGRNLASLAGDFALNFDHGPLANSGLFAITGPTGAGKSTLLDALCVALFDRTPRLSTRSLVTVGHAHEDEAMRLSATDVRSLLRRGAAEGYAEVDFAGRDDIVYQARWSVRRARGKADGRMQAQTIELRNLNTGDALGGTKSETLATIEAKLGFSFEQFRRSALLAQGEFSAFLRANARERADLLERITGTEIYGKISQVAFRRGADEHKKLDILRKSTSNQSVMDNDERSTLEQALQAATAQLVQAQARYHDYEAARGWLDTLESLQTERDAAIRQYAQTESAWQAYEPQRERLARHETVSAARPYFEELARVESTRDSTGTRRDKLHEQARAHSALVDKLAGQQTRADTAYRQAKTDRDDSRPQLRQAAELDGDIEKATAALSTAQQERARIDERRRKVDADHSTTETQKAQTERDLAKAIGWKDEFRAQGRLAENWNHWRDMLVNATELQSRLTAKADEHDRIGAQLTDSETTSASTQAVVTQAKQDLAVAESALAKAGGGVDPSDFETLQTRLSGARRQQQSVTALEDIARRARDIKIADQDLETGIADLNDRVTRECAKSEQLQQDILLARVRRDEARRAVEQSIAAGELSQHRANLQPGDECPLCGSVEHPWAERESQVIRSLIDDQRSRLQQLENELEQSNTALSTSRAAIATAEQTIARHRQARQDYDDKLQKLASDWLTRLREVGELALMADPAHPDTEAWLERRRTAASEHIDKLHNDEKALRKRSEQLRVAQGRVEAARSHVDTSVRAAREVETRRQELQRHYARCAAELDSLHKQRDDVLTTLDGAFPGDGAGPLAQITDVVETQGWRHAWRSAPNAFTSQLQAFVEDWRRTTTEIDAGHTRLERLTSQGEVLATQRSEIADDITRSDRELAQHQHALAQSQAARAALFGGRSVAEVGAALDDNVQKTEVAASEATTAHAQANDELKVLASTQNTLAERWDELGVELERLRLRCRKVAAELGISETEVTELLAWSDDDRGAIKDKSDTLTNTRQRLRTVVSERSSRYQDHLASQPQPLVALAQSDDDADHHDSAPLDQTIERVIDSAPDDAREPSADDPRSSDVSVLRPKLERALEAARSQVKTHQDEVSRLAGRIAVDDAAHKQLAALGDELVAQEQKVVRYRGLSDLIGSADGKKFRTFAQSLTLDTLLAHANDQLEILAHRYRLARVPGFDLDIQVIDRAMGDEVRSVHSLSGGESFLVSLALALGLSALSSRDARVESLMIDEGFGSLDASSLEIALAALDSLQASGRKVGIISHVPGLAERIGVCVDVVPQGGGRSKVHVRAAA